MRLFSRTKFIYVSLLIATIFLVAPFFYISIYNHPSADDYCYSDFGRSMGFWSAQVEHYLSWTGRYMATALLTVSPIDYNELTFYRVLPGLLFIIFGVSILVFVKAIIPGAETRDKAVLGFIIFFLYLYNVPDITEAFYWMPGAITYQLASILSLLLFSLVLRFREHEQKFKRRVLLVLACLMVITIVGLNEVSMMMLCIIFLGWFVMDFYRKRSVDTDLLVLLLVTIAAAAVVVAAPGNLVRMSEKPEKFQLFFSVYGSLSASIISIIKWSPVLLLLVFFFLKNMNRVAMYLRVRAGFSTLSWKHLLMFAVFSFGLLVLGFFPSFWSQGGEPPARTVNAIYLLFILEALALIIGLLVYLQNRNRSVALLPASVRILLGILVLTLVFFKSNNISRVYQDLGYGKALKYDLEMQERYRLIEKCGPVSCLVPAIENRPTTIFAYELAWKPSQEHYFINLCLDAYFKKSDIRIPSQE